MKASSFDDIGEEFGMNKKPCETQVRLMTEPM